MSARQECSPSWSLYTFHTHAYTFQSSGSCCIRIIRAQQVQLCISLARDIYYCYLLFVQFEDFEIIHVRTMVQYLFYRTCSRLLHRKQLSRKILSTCKSSQSRQTDWHTSMCRVSDREDVSQGQRASNRVTCGSVCVARVGPAQRQSS